MEKLLRRLLIMHPHAVLSEGSTRRSFAIAQQALAGSASVRGMRFDEHYHPVRISGRASARANRPRAAGFNYISRRQPNSDAFALRAHFDDEDAVARLRADCGDWVAGVYADLPIGPCLGVQCQASAVGDLVDVRAALGLGALIERDLTGKGVRIAIVDAGINRTIVPVSAIGWSPDPTYVPGSAPRGHGSMCAFDAQIAAPDAEFLDFAARRSTSETFQGFLGDVVMAYSELIELMDSSPGPLVVNNSWSIYDRDFDDPIGSSGNYSANPNHILNQIVSELVARGADVIFAAGNCGGDCASPNCGINDRGPGQSIHGANSHPDVLTVAAVTVAGDRLGNSSQGPGALSQQKPDVANFARFSGSRINGMPDDGTSAACALTAGVIASLRESPHGRALSPTQMRALIQRTATDVNGSGWDLDIGFGVVNATAAANLV